MSFRKNLHLLVCFILVSTTLAPFSLQAQDFIDQQESEAGTLLEIMRSAPPAPMPDEVSSSEPDSPDQVSNIEDGLLVGVDLRSGNVETMSTTSRLPRLDSATDRVPSFRPEGPRSVGGSPLFDEPFWLSPEGISPTESEGSAAACSAPSSNLYTHTFPWSTNYKLLVRFLSGGSSYYYLCSAASMGSFHLLTAGHCIYNHDPNQDGSTADAGFAAEVWAWAAQTDLINPFMGSAADEDRPYGFAKSVYMRSYTGWTQNRNLDYDIAYITLDRRDGDHTGWMGREANVTATTLNFNGYPSETPYVPSGEIRQYPGFDTGNVNYYTTNRINLCAFSYGGHSGGPTWRYDGAERYIQGVNSTSNRSGVAESARITSGRLSDITAIMSEDESLRPPVARPDLTEYVFSTTDDLKDLLTNVVAEGGAFSVEYNVLNAGFAHAGTVTVDFYLSTNSIISSGDTLVGTRTLSLDAWTYSNTTTSLSATVPPGNYYVGWIMRSSVPEYTGDQVCNGAPCTNVVVIADELLTVTEADSCAADAYEPDNTAGSARLLSSGLSQNHNICPETDVDWLTFILSPTAGQWAVDLATSGATGDTRMWLYDSSLSEIEFNDDGGSGLFSRIDRTCGSDALPPGTYYVKIDEFGNNNTIDAYTVSMSSTPCADPQPDIHVTPTSLSFDSSSPSASEVVSQPFGASIFQQAPSPEKAIETLAVEAQAAGQVRVIVGLETDVPFLPEGLQTGTQAVATQRRNIALAQERLLTDLEGTRAQLNRRFETLPFMALTMDVEALKRLRSVEGIRSVELDVAVPPTMSSSNPVIGSPAAWSAGYTGTGQAVAVLDTGVDSGHPFFTNIGNKVVSEACYSSNTNDSTSLCPGGVESSTAVGSGSHCSGSISGCDHGTHVAGTAAGDDGSGPHFGVGRGANLIAMQVFSRFDTTSACGLSVPCVLSYTSDQIAALERVFALRNTYDIAAVNMSLGGGQYSSEADCDAANVSRKAAIDSLRSVGIATVISAGNNGYTSSLGAPGCISSAIAVGATTDSDAVASFSNISSFVDLVAPGVSITSSVPGTGTGTKNGTSMSAPHVAGAFAVLKQAAPQAGVQELLNALQSTATSVDDQRSGGSVTGLHRINLDQAVNLVKEDGRSFQISNLGTGPLTVSSLILSSSAPWIDWTPKAPFTVAPGAGVNIQVTVDWDLAPQGFSTRQLLIYSDDPDESPYPGAVQLNVTRDASTLIFEDGFESGDTFAWSSQ